MADVVRFLAAVLFATAFASLPQPARAHAFLVKSSPAQRAVLHRAPAKVELWFNEGLEPRYSSLSVLDAAGKPLELGAVDVPADGAKRLSAPVMLPGPGRYTVRYRVLSKDGHVVQGRFAFTVVR